MDDNNNHSHNGGGLNSSSNSTSSQLSYFFKKLKNFWNIYKFGIVSTLLIFLLLEIFFNDNSKLNSKNLQKLNDLLMNNNLLDFNQTDIIGASNNNNNKDDTFASSSSSSSHQLTKPPKKNPMDFYTIESRLNYYFPYHKKSEIENNIFQIWLTKADDKNFPTDCKPHIERWREVNDGFNHNLLSLNEVEESIVDYFKPTVPEIIEALRSLPHDRLKFEFLKYLVIYINGGLYADIDSVCIKPLKYWYDSKLISGKLLVGITNDFNDLNWEKLYNRRLEFSNNIFRAKSHHPFLAKLIARITYISFTQSELIKNSNWDEIFQNVDANGEPLVQFTGPSIFTDTLFEYLNSLKNSLYIRVAKNDRDKDIKPIIGPDIPEGQRYSYKSFSGAIAPSQVEDVIVLPPISFQGQPLKEDNYQSKNDEYDDEDSKKGYEKFYYARPLALTMWSSKKKSIPTNDINKKIE
ncbi:alpha-1,6-mannosyltransferase activity protein [[Candida] boidinii]|nr:alpha-1,6-mannosyltransferase activity protein [[Candida] boidinii]OWB79471.1 alpha-1,6-mannosyltransferase activity protein [[Candida] boidinii]